MKSQIVFAFVVLSSNYCLIAMDQTKQDELTATEKASYDWFVELQKQLPAAFQKLSSEDREIFEKQVRYTDNPEAVTRSRNNFAELFYGLVQEAKIQPKYELETLKSAFLKIKKTMDSQSIAKPTDILSARMYVFSRLTEQEKLTYSQENYSKNPEAAHQVTRKWSNLVSEELVKLHLVEDTETAKKQKAEELYQEQIARFQKSYIAKQ